MNPPPPPLRPLNGVLCYCVLICVLCAPRALQRPERSEQRYGIARARCGVRQSSVARSHLSLARRPRRELKRVRACSVPTSPQKLGDFSVRSLRVVGAQKRPNTKVRKCVEARPHRLWRLAYPVCLPRRGDGLYLAIAVWVGRQDGLVGSDR